MQANLKIVKILVFALLVSTVLGACGGGSTGSTWFNLPSIPVTVQANGAAKVFGFDTGAVVLQPAQLQQLQSANVQKLEVRIGYNGIHVYANGEDLPYIKWNENSASLLQDILRNLPNIPNGAQIAGYLPWLRQIGLGVALYLPNADGSRADYSAMRWSGETTVAEEAASDTPIGPFTIGSLAFDPEGNAVIEGIPGATLEEALGTSLPKLDANTLGILSAIGADNVKVSTQPNGIDLMLNDQQLPSIAYDSASLGRVLSVAGPFLGDPSLVDTLSNLVPKLPDMDLDVAVSFTGEPAAQTELGTVPVEIQEDGSLAVFGLPVSSMDAGMVQKLQAADVQNLAVDVGAEGLFLAANGQVLPSITWTDDSLGKLAGIVGPLANMSPDLINTGLDMVRNTGIKANVALPGGSSDGGAEFDRTLAAVDMGDFAPPVLHLNATFKGEMLDSVDVLSAEDLAALGLEEVSLPPNVATILSDLGAQEVEVVTSPNQLDIILDGTSALTLNYDQAALQQALAVAAPFLEGTPLEDPTVAALVQEHILPLVPGADVDIKLMLE